MAATIAKDSAISDQPQAIGQFKVAVRTLTPDASYPAGGYAVTAAAVGLAKILFVVLSGTGGYVSQWNPATGKVQMFRQSAATSALTEPTGVDVSASPVELLIFGY